jgi:translation initiation factor IF-3
VHRINEEITNKKVRIVGSTYEGEMSLTEALNVAEEEGMDLVEMSDNNGVSICKLMNYSKFLYEQKKSKKVQKKAVLKEIKMGCNIADHDIKVSAKKALNILNDGDKIKVMVIFKGRQVMFANEQGQEILEKFLNYFEEGFVVVTKNIKLEGNMVTMQIEKSK